MDPYLLSQVSKDPDPNENDTEQPQGARTLPSRQRFGASSQPQESAIRSSSLSTHFPRTETPQRTDAPFTAFGTPGMIMFGGPSTPAATLFTQSAPNPAVPATQTPGGESEDVDFDTLYAQMQAETQRVANAVNAAADTSIKLFGFASTDWAPFISQLQSVVRDPEEVAEGQRIIDAISKDLEAVRERNKKPQTRELFEALKDVTDRGIGEFNLAELARKVGDIFDVVPREEEGEIPSSPPPLT